MFLINPDYPSVFQGKIASAEPVPSDADLLEPPTNLFVTFIEFTSIAMQNTKGNAVTQIRSQIQQSEFPSSNDGYDVQRKLR